MAEYVQILESWNRKLCNKSLDKKETGGGGGGGGGKVDMVVSDAQVYIHGVINNFQILMLKLLCNGCLILMDVLTYHQVQVGVSLNSCSSVFGANVSSLSQWYITRR